MLSVQKITMFNHVIHIWLYSIELYSSTLHGIPYLFLIYQYQNHYISILSELKISRYLVVLCESPDKLEEFLPLFGGRLLPACVETLEQVVQLINISVNECSIFKDFLFWL